MASESFTSEQIRTVRRVFNEHCDPIEGGLRLESFGQTLEACLLAVHLPQPPPQYLSSELRRLSTTGIIPWQQFFQVLIHINVNHAQGVGYEEEWATPLFDPPAPSPHPPDTDTANGASHNHQEPLTTAAGSAAGDGITQSSRSRVGFIDSPEIVTVPAQADYIMPTEPSTSWGQTLRRGGAILSRAVGNFFGVTEESQHGTSDQMGWGLVGEMSAEEVFTTSRRLSFRNRHGDEPPPEYPGPAPLPGQVEGRSFDPAELGDSSDEDDEDVFIAPAPPDYQDVIGSEQPPAVVPTQRETVFVDVHHANMGQVANSHTPASVPLAPRSTQQQYPPPTHQQQPATRQPEPAVTPGRTDLIYDANEAWKYYLRFVQAERGLRQRRHHEGAFEFFGSVDAVEMTTNDVGRRGSLRRDLGAPSDSQQVELRRHGKKKKNTKLQRQSTLVRHKVESLPSFTPWFIIVMSILQVVVMIVLLAINGVATVHAIPRRRNETFPSLSNNNSNATAPVVYYRAVNLWIGMSPQELIRIGAKFTPCMRRDFGIQRRNSDIYGSRQDNLGCCKNQDNVGTVLSLPECACSASERCFLETNDTDIAYAAGSCVDNFGQNSTIGLATFHPCCVSITGRCRITSAEECDARGGQYHPTLESCLQVNCLEGICGFNGAAVGFDDDIPYLPNANQFWRWFLSIFIHLGVIHIVLVMPIQLYIGFKIERTIGWVRVGLIYLISGVGGNILSAIFVPYGVNAGASGAVLGLIGVLFVELFQFWQIVDNALLELAKLLGFVIFLLALGTLPFIDNMAHIGGLLFGVVAAVIFVPYITFGTLDTFRKRVLLAICVPLLFMLFLASLLTFYLIPDSSFCPGCGYINCIPYVSELCPDEYRNPDPEIFSL